jgi:putative oxidoreductase
MYGIQTDEFSEQWAPYAVAALRIVTALLFLEHATSKLLGWPHSSMSFPPTWSLFWIAGLIELIGSILILLGGWTRWVAIVLAGEMAIAYFYVHVPKGPYPLLNNGEASILFCFIFLMLAVVGAGKWSIDEARAKRHSDVWGYAAPGGERPGLDEE